MKRVHVDNYAPKYYSGKWSWDSKKDALHFEPHNDLSDARERYITTNTHKFMRTINQEEELIFRQEFVRSESSFDNDTVVIYDIRDLVLFLMPTEFLTYKFVEFMHKPAVYRLLHSLTIYFEYYLRMVEFVLIRRDELSGQMAQIQSEQTNDMKRVFSVYLSQYRMLVARNYSVIIKGEGDMGKYYHMKEIVNISATIWDKNFHEQFLACSTQIVWIAMHRRAYNVIEMEMNRLFRSEHFVTSRPEYLSFTPAERSLLYGRNSKIVNYRTQVSPLIQELQHIQAEDLPILWIGERKYRGTDIRIMEMELEYIVPGPQLRLIDVAHGILGHPKKLYNTLLELDWPSVRYSNFSKHHDPYHIIRQPHLDIPKIDAMKMRQMTEQYEHFYEIHNLFETCHRQVIFKWLRREKIIKFYRSGGLLTNIVSRCEKELATTAHGPRVDQIIANYFKVKSRLRKEAQSREGDDDTVASGRIGNNSPKEKNQVADMFYD
ncbi:GL12631 [Drosophila persimilis]|uniref:Protein phosphatase 1 regulatory subunit 36 n=2 Tax=pseudoobscura subgroup TaxID=32358 RepID=A0A6I8US36_DROPS|nr:uncharacterized protein LOC4803229 [Drosophila pseudoobscura]XP_002019864.1 uncharacterized protein LOC6594065 [Drosophila persimilis]EDW38498.1 GL12631 [Drosophila persimilis]